MLARVGQVLVARVQPLGELCSAAALQSSSLSSTLRGLVASSTSTEEASTSYASSATPLLGSRRGASSVWAQLDGGRRSFAAAGKGGADSAEPPKRRRSMSKLWSVRNDKLRNNFEQIWPTQKLTEEEAAAFRRNSRLFVVDLGKTITLRNKFYMNQSEKPPISQVPSLLYESNLHLDAVGEHPRYLKVRRTRSAYAHKLQNVRKLRVLMGFKRRYAVQRLYEHALSMQGPNRTWKLVCALESKLSTFALRMGLAEDVLGADKAVKQNRVVVNGSPMPMKHAGFVQPGDVVGPGLGSKRYFQDRIARSLGPVVAADLAEAAGFGSGGSSPSRPQDYRDRAF